MYHAAAWPRGKCKSRLKTSFLKQDTLEQDPLSIDIDIDPSVVENRLESFFEDPATFPSQETSYTHPYGDAEQNFYTNEGLLSITNLKDPSHSHSVKLESRAGSAAQQWLSESNSNQPQQIQSQEFDNILATQEEPFNVLADALSFVSATPLNSVYTQFQVLLAP